MHLSTPVHHSLHLPSVALDELPAGVPSHIQQLDSHSDELVSIACSSTEPAFKSEKLQPPILLSNSLPPVPTKLVKMVKQGLCMEMAELSPSYLNSAEVNTGNQPVSRKPLPKVLDIVEWVQCFGIYMAIVSRSKPKRIADLIGYQSLIIAASQNCREGSWAMYDRRFHLKASASHNEQWSTIDVTIWNMTFPDRAIKSHQSQGVIPHDLVTQNFTQHSLASLARSSSPRRVKVGPQPCFVQPSSLCGWTSNWTSNLIIHTVSESEWQHLPQ